MRYKIYTDGACSGNPGPGGWAAIILLDDKIKNEISGSEKNTTNNKMELLAPIKAIQKFKKKSEILIYTDSTYVKDGIWTAATAAYRLCPVPRPQHTSQQLTTTLQWNA